MIRVFHLEKSSVIGIAGAKIIQPLGYQALQKGCIKGLFRLFLTFFPLNSPTKLYKKGV